MIVAMGAARDPRSDRGDAAAPPAAGLAAGRAGASVDARWLRRALDATRAVPSGRVEVTTTITGRPGARVVHRAAFDRAAGRAEAETDMTGLVAALGPSGVPPGDFSVPTRMVVVGDVVYSQVGPMAEAYGLAATDWVRVDLAAFAAPRLDSDTAALLLDPLGPFDVLAEPLAEIRMVGEDEVRGSPVTHVAARSGAEGGADVSLEVWVDADGRVRRLELRFDAGRARPAGRSLVGGLVSTVELFDVGAAIDIAPPDPADVLDPSSGR
jgi:hypothetical protein